MMKLIVLISGNGSNLQALIDAIDAGHLDAEIALVASNKEKAYGLTRAKEAGIETLYFPLKPYKANGKSREQYDADLAAKLEQHKPDLIVLAGWMHILSAAFLDAFPNKIINLHPALPGEFPGTDAIGRAYEAFLAGDINRSGVMVHFVTEEVDVGEVIIKAEVPILESDSVDDFQHRMHATEHQVIVQAVALYQAKHLDDA